MSDAQTEQAREIIMLALLQRRFTVAGRSAAAYRAPPNGQVVNEDKYTPRPNKNADLEALQEEAVSRFSKTLAYLAK